jgi:hypothetical protein
VNLSETGLDDEGIRELCEGLKSNSTVTDLNLAYNHFGGEGAKTLLEALAENQSIKKLNLSGNALGFRSINAIVCACQPKGVTLNTEGNYVFEEILNSVSHGVAFIFSVVAANVLISNAADFRTSEYPFWACVIYSFSLMFLFLSSCLFHSFFMSPHG